MITSLFFWFILSLMSCGSNEPDPIVEPPIPGDFYFGSDLSYVNQILNHDGVYKDLNIVKDPYQIFKENGNNLVRLRLWHNPAWTKEVYDPAGSQLYNDLKDVEKSITLAKAQGMKVLLDFHYSDEWADPGKQYIPAAWEEIKSITVLKDSVYNYTFKTLQYLNSKGLLPELVQIGNETNCGMFFSEAPTGFPTCNVCDGSWSNMGAVLNAGIKAVRDITATTTIKTKIILHVADPKNVQWWFDNILSQGSVTDFDMVGFSYYPLWHTTVGINDISTSVSGFKSRYLKDVIILETAYPWTTAGDDSYNNQFGPQTPVSGFPFTVQGQYDFMKKLTTEVKDGGGIGVVYWEPAWITSNLKDLWGTGSTWENCAFFDFDGNKIKGIEYMKADF
ncbi:MAG TPA: glycosyl hydrolase 53 family protein [Chryseolinea sp.]|nr:glycosyl hydrolase 53 family protein [Chryseolinea sp.]HPM31199.1 glycosyl hydrolase 53 family protein [Chryseolinea sp.]